mmetsp:Transcript_30670/g.72371  ORF Transcript_30670/g.72371 Transcript_30670/m.72371 type:complete len:420 (-) Transcript_30670:136-1395(-)
MRGRATCCEKALAMAPMPPAAATASQLCGMRRHMLPMAETPSVSMAPLLGWRIIAWMMATWPCARTMEVLHWSLPEMLARKKQACLATPASVMWLPSSVMARESASMLARLAQIWSVTVRRESVASSSASGPGVWAIGPRAAVSNGGSTPSSTACLACSRPLLTRERLSSASVEARKAPHAASSVGGSSTLALSTAHTCLRSLAELQNCWRSASCTSIAARAQCSAPRSTAGCSACCGSERMSVMTATPRGPRRSRFSAFMRTTASASRITGSAEGLCITASAELMSASTAPWCPARITLALSDWHSERIAAADMLSFGAISAPHRRKVARILPSAYGISIVSSSSASSSSSIMLRTSRTTTGSSSGLPPGALWRMLLRLMPWLSNCEAASATASSASISNSSMFSCTTWSNVSCEMRA